MRIVIVHGSLGHPEENWFPWLRRALEERGAEVLVPSFPTPNGQNLQMWSLVWHKDVGHAQGPMIVIGHSLGGTFLLRILERSDYRMAGAFFIGSPIGTVGDPYFDGLNLSFVEGGFRWSDIRKSSDWIGVYHARDDPMVPSQMGHTLAKRVSADIYFSPAEGGHFNEAAGFTTFPALLAGVGRAMGDGDLGQAE